MASIFQNDFSGGWVPSEDYINGRPNGLTHSENLVLDDQGAIQLGKTVTKLNASTLGQQIVKIFSRAINGINKTFVQLADGRVLYDNVGDFTFATTALPNYSGGAKTSASFGQGFGRIFTASPGGHKVLTSSGIKQWGYAKPPQPHAVVVAGPRLNCWSGGNPFFDATITKGTPDPAGPSPFMDTIVVVTEATTGAGEITQDSGNLNAFSDGGVADDDDYVGFYFTAGNGNSTVLSVTLRFYIDVASGPSYYEYIWYPTTNPTDALLARRGDFKKYNSGTSTNNSWEAVVNYSITAYITQPLGKIQFGHGVLFQFTGGSHAKLNNLGDTGLDPNLPGYSYLQVWVNDNGNYLGASPASDATPPYSWRSYKTVITPDNTGMPSDITDIYIYKTGGNLEKYYLVGTCKPGSTVTDGDRNDNQILADNEFLNPYLISTDTLLDGDAIISIAGPVNGRMALMTQKNIYFTEYLNPDAIDPRMTLQLSGDLGEVNMFMERVGGAQLVAATNLDFYEVTGTFQEQSDSIFDIAIRAMGIRHPPISPSYTIYNGALIYVASDGLRNFSGSDGQILSNALDYIWNQGQHYTEGRIIVSAYDPGAAAPQGIQLSLYKNKLLAKVTQQLNSDFSFAVLEHDFTRNTWTKKNTIPPSCFFTREDGLCLTGYADGFVRLWDDALTYDGSGPQHIYFQTLAQSGGSPNSRKDLLDLTIRYNGGPFDVFLVDETGLPNIVGTLTGTAVGDGGILEGHLQVNGIGINKKKAYSLLIKDANNAGILNFRLVSWELQYLEYPEQTVFLYIQPNNFGIASMKAIRALPLMIDTKGQNVIFQPLVDGVTTGCPPLTINTTNKKSVVYEFPTTVQYGIDYSGTLTAQTTTPFEFYGFEQPRNCEALPLPLVTDMIGPFVADKRGKLQFIRFRVLPSGVGIDIKLAVDGNPSALLQTMAVTPGVDTTYEIRCPPGIIGNVFRVYLTASDGLPFSRWTVQLRLTSSGMQTDGKWVTIK